MTHATIGTHPRGISDENISIGRSISTIQAILILLAISVIGGVIGGAIIGGIVRIGERDGQDEIKIGSLHVSGSHETAHLGHQHSHVTQHAGHFQHAA